MLPVSAFAALIGHTVTVTHNIEDVSFLGDNKFESKLAFDTPTDIDNKSLYQCGIKNYWQNVKESKTLVSVTITSGDASKTIDVSVEHPSSPIRTSFAADLGISGSEASLRQLTNGIVIIYFKNITACKDDINVTFNWQLELAPNSQIVLESSGNGVAEKHFKENPTAESSRYELTATPNAGYMLDYWVWKADGYTSSPETDADNDGYPDANKIINPDDNSAATIDQTITEDRSYKAVFKPAQFIFRYDTVQIEHNTTANPGENAKKYGYVFTHSFTETNIPESDRIKEFGDACITVRFATPSEILPGTKKSIALYKNDERTNPFYTKDFIRQEDPSLAIPAGILAMSILYKEELEYMETMTVALTLGDVTVYKEHSLGAPMIPDPISEVKTAAYAELKSTYEDCIEEQADKQALLEDVYRQGKKDIAGETRPNVVRALKDDIKEKMAKIAAGGEADAYVAVTVEVLTVSYGKELIAKPTLVGICGSTKVYSVIKQALQERYPDVSSENLMKGNDSYIAAVYRLGYTGSHNGENYIGEFDVGDTSGWMYSVDDKFPNVGVGEKTVTGGETVRLQYTCALGQDMYGNGRRGALIYTMARLRKDYSEEQLMGTATDNPLTEEQVNAYKAAETLLGLPYPNQENLDAANENLLAAFDGAVVPPSGPGPVDNVIELINAIGDVGSSSGSAIEAARSAYNALSDVQKILVTNYDTLLRAESAYAALAPASNPTNSHRNSALQYVKSQAAQPKVGSTGGEWAVLAVARDLGTADHSEWYGKYLAALDDKLNAVGFDGIGGENKYTEYARITLALSALGIDASAYEADGAEYDFTAKLSETDKVEAQGINGPTFALIALDSKPYAPENTEIREHYVDYIVGKAIADGGWNLNEDADVADVDMTAMVMQALAPYYNTNPAVKAAVDKAITALRNAQDKVAGGFYSWGTYCSESTAQVIVALASLGIDPTGADWTVNINRNPVTALMQFRDAATGGFKHAVNGGVDQMASEQSAYALVAYDRFLKDRATLYDMSDAFDTQIRDIKVKGYKAEPGEGNTFTAELPYGSDLSALTAGEFAIAAASPRAGVSAPATGDGGATWTFTLTSPSGMTTVECTINVTVSSDETTEEVATVRTAIDGMDFSCPMAAANTEAAVKRRIENKLSSLDLNGVSAAVEMDSFAAASAGTASNASGTPGSFTFTVTLSKGDAGYTLTKTAEITALEYSGEPGSSESENISVSFRLIGAELATSDVDLSNSDYMPDYITWIPTTVYTISEGGTVYDLFAEATRANGIRSVGGENNYVETIYAPSVFGAYALSEFTNGRFSGWMYTVNGDHPNVGLKYCALQEDDVVVWHYVNDYRHEVADWFDDPDYPALGNGTYYNTWLNAEDVAPPAGGSGGSSASEPGSVIEQKTKVGAGGAEAVVDSKAVDAAVDAAKKSAVNAVTVIPTETGDAENVTTTLPTESVGKIADAGLALNVETPGGSVEIPSEALAEIAKSAEGDSISVNVAKQDKAAAEEYDLDEEVALVAEVTITSGGKEITSFGGHAISVYLPVDESDFTEGESYEVLVISKGGSSQLLEGICVRRDGKLFVKVEIDHLSTFIVTRNKPLPFKDVKGHWAIKGVRFAYNRGFMAGVSPAKFNPDGKLTRGMLVTMLHSLEGKPGVTLGGFSDVAGDKWYAAGVAWAKQKGIVAGFADGTFRPEELITREQFATIMMSYAGFKNQDVSKRADLSAYSDAGETSAWALDALKWAKATGLMSGRSESVMAPKGTATRAEAATILMNYLKSISQ